ncbi:MAG: alpha/beta hydrolase [Deltaproteobacteria bacterium]|nr:alpha/beta hydrolase [Deltaproteobacteria bacterium]
MTRPAFDVTVHGQGRPVVLIPGASCGPVVWESTVARLRDRYELHVLRLSGFAGRPAIEGPLLATVRADLADYLATLAPNRPVVVGHSLGGFFAFAVAADHPERVGGAVVVDAVPAFGQQIAPGADAAAVGRVARSIHRGTRALSPDQFRDQVVASLAPMINDSGQARTIMDEAERSDPRAVADAMLELRLTDLREAVAQIVAPVLAVIPLQPELTPDQRSATQAWHSAQLAPIAHYRLVAFAGARHFVMVDAPDRFCGDMTRFLEDRVDWPPL